MSHTSMSIYVSLRRSATVRKQRKFKLEEKVIEHHADSSFLVVSCYARFHSIYFLLLSL